MKNNIFSLLLTTLLLFSMVACKKGQESDPNTVTVAIELQPATLDPRFALDAYGQRISNLIFNSLVRVGPELKVIGEAAESWDYKNLGYTFLLRPHLKFSNGTNVTAEDIEFSFQEYMKKTNPFSITLKFLKSVEVNEIEIDGDKRLQVKLSLKEFYAPLLSDLSRVKILPKKIVQEKGDDFQKHLIGTGSFKLASQSANEIVLEAVENHHWKTPKINKVVFKIVKDTNTLFLKTIKGEIDISQAAIPKSKIVALENKEHLQVFKYPSTKMAYLIMNLRDDILKNHEVRKAIAMAIDREKIIKFSLEGLAKAATSVLPPTNPFHNKNLSTPSFNPQEAKKIFEKHGLSNKKIIFKSSNSPDTVERAKIIANQLREAGLNVSVQSFEWGTYFKDVKSGNFQIALMQWVGLFDPDIYRVAFHSDNLPPLRNRGYYINKTLDKLLDDGLKISNPAKRIEHYHKVQEIVVNDLPTIPLWYDTDTSVVHRRIKNYTPPLNGDFSPLLEIAKIAE